ncbi:MAG: DNA polymerase IV [Patescibacteria group bacterium]|nr:DNA polymerase IV [Patescibacteria group bacterium]
MPKIILHIDFDSYFASCEQQFDSKLRGKPIGVTAHNGRTCIIAASREAKALGIKSPSRTFEALEKIPSMIFVPAHFEKYWEITQKFLNICKDYSPFVELFSLDEVFIDITATQNLHGDKYQLISKIRERIKNEIGEYITVSVGISYNKLLSKLASGLNKPNGFFELTPQNLDEIYEKAKLTDICGIGERIAARLNELGIYNLLDLRKTSKYTLEVGFGKAEANFLEDLSLGIDNSAIVPYTVSPSVKSVGRNYCLPYNEYDKRVVLQNVYELCEEVAIKLRRLNKKARTVWFYLGGSSSTHARKTTGEYFDSGAEIFNICMNILKQDNFQFGDKDYVRRISVGASSLEDVSNISLSLFSYDVKKQKLLGTVDKLNEKYGDHTIRNGFLLYADKLKTVPNGWMADKYERTKLSLLEF